MKRLFNWRLRLVQKGYDVGWKHGYEAGMSEHHKQIVDLLNKNIEDIDWGKEEPFKLREVVPLVKEYKAELDHVGWNK